MILSPLQVSILRSANSQGGTLDANGTGFLRAGEIADLEAQGLIEAVKDKPGVYAVTAAGNLELASAVL